MRTRTLGNPGFIALAMAAGLALLVLLTSPFAAKPVAAQNTPDAAGDGTQILGGATSGTTTAVNTTVGNSANYVISAVVPGDGNFYGAVVEITYDATKVTPTCPEETVSGDTRVYCNDSYPGNKVRIAIESSTVSGSEVIGMTGTNSLVTISFLGEANTSPSPSAITSMVVIGDCINGAGEDITCTATAGNLTVGGGASFPWGDANCSGSVTSTDISIIVFVVAGGTRPAGCSQPIDLNCSSSMTSTDISMVVFIAAGGTINPCSAMTGVTSKELSNQIDSAARVVARHDLTSGGRYDAS